MQAEFEYGSPITFSGRCRPRIILLQECGWNPGSGCRLYGFMLRGSDVCDDWSPEGTRNVKTDESRAVPAFHSA